MLLEAPASAIWFKFWSAVVTLLTLKGLMTHCCLHPAGALSGIGSWPCTATAQPPNDKSCQDAKLIPVLKNE